MMDEFTFRVLAKSWPQIFMASPGGPTEVVKPTATNAKPIANQCEESLAVRLTAADRANCERIANEVIADHARQQAEQAQVAERLAKQVEASVRAVLNGTPDKSPPESPAPQVKPRPDCGNWLTSDLPAEDPSNAMNDVPHPYGIGSELFI
jgi:hypothetical protein